MHAPNLLAAFAWLVALAWLAKTIAAARGLPRVANLLLPAYDRMPDGMPTITVIVPGRDEAANIQACLQSLLLQDYPNLTIIAVNDRSSDKTGALMDGFAALHPTRLSVLHVTELPDGWLGKVHAMALAARQAAVLTQPDFLLFTDADVIFRPDALRRTLVQVVATQADHFVTLPTMTIRRWDEAVVLGFFQVFGLWGPRLWRIEDSKSLRDAVGIGAFNLLRRSAYLQLGGFEAQRMDILEDFTLARRVRQAGLRQRIAFGRNLVNVHWAAGAFGLVGVMTKNMFSAFRFHISLCSLCCAWLLLFCVAPAFGLFYSPTRIACVMTFATLFWAFRLYGRHSGISAWNAALFPFGAAIFIITLLRSMIVTLVQGGVRWRGTFYPLAELRLRLSPFTGPVKGKIP